MAKEYFPMADKPTLDEINANVGKSTDTANSAGSTSFSLLKWLVSVWTNTRATKVDNLDATISSRAAASEVGTRADAATTTINTTNTIVSMVKGLLGASNATGGSATAGGANAKLNKLINDVATLSSNVSSIKTTIAAGIGVKRVIRGSVSIPYNGTVNVPISPELDDTTKCMVILQGAGYYVGGTPYGGGEGGSPAYTAWCYNVFPTYVLSTTQLTLSLPGAQYAATIYYQIVEYA